ncbi:MAG TPA: glycosyltransferase family 4 protein [Blastocatellia bacterium]|nr:glycosyltransferase family 4 protein [Blastocatellia bacterium]
MSVQLADLETVEVIADPIVRSAAPRVLLAAYQCGPGMGSVSQIGWEWYSRLSRRIAVTLITHIRNREALHAAGAPFNDSEIIYIDTEWFAGPLYRFAKKIFPTSEHSVFLVSSLDFFVYDRDALKLLKKRMKMGERWDIVHAVTPVSTVAPTRLHSLGSPVVLGPLNAGLGTPRAFADVLKGDSPWLYPVRNFGRVIDWIVGSTRNAATILTATKATIESVPARHHQRCKAMLENGVELNRFHASPWPDPPSKTNPLRVLFVGRLVPFKAVGLLLEAGSRARREFPIEVTIVGEGPMLEEWKSISKSLALDDCVSFLGSQSLDEVAKHMRAAHVFCLPSVRESGGAVLLEAMASARPVIAVAFGGPAEIVDDGVGVAIPPDGREPVIAGIASAFKDICQNPELWRARGEEGRRRAEELYGWDAKIESAIQLYQRMINR